MVKTHKYILGTTISFTILRILLLPTKHINSFITIRLKIVVLFVLMLPFSSIYSRSSLVPYPKSTTYFAPSNNNLSICFNSTLSFPYVDILKEGFLIDNLSCTQPMYWKNYYYDYNFSKIHLAFRIFGDDLSATDHFVFLVEELDNFVYNSSVSGGRIQNIATVVPFELGYVIDDIELFKWEKPDEFEDSTYYLFSVIRARDTVYMVLEESKNDIVRRKFTTSFRPELHDAYLERMKKKLID